MATKPLGKGTTNMTLNVPSELAEKLTKLASKSGMSRSRYCKEILASQAQQGKLLEIIVRELSKDGSE